MPKPKVNRTMRKVRANERPGDPRLQVRELREAFLRANQKVLGTLSDQLKARGANLAPRLAEIISEFGFRKSNAVSYHFVDTAGKPFKVKIMSKGIKIKCFIEG